MIVTHIIKDQCPHCYQGKVFENANLLSFKSGKMNTACPCCHTSFTREPGFYWGSMYASYALAVVEAFITYFVCRAFGTEAFAMTNLWVILSVMIVLSPFNFRLARLIWLYIFSAIEE